ncbi:LacI family transcriptional regulator [Brachybacterium halotolerans subsp. kimchii]|uniref:LacI family DNA-binding transcriptional regulator n=1 Tax=Brachybacterium halotolerans TaxID=2795215 RepID=UPI001E57F3D7|nr:LacI family DNA-binding transcriptional regulator [Brachybacterium halotolerans]UEJ81625.1 LacI family transcriptional regulator [Brachybacterium halotolerans subsp. kimchii]
MPAVRLTDVARDAGVSLATASRVLNGSDRVPGKDVAERVQRSAAKLGYVTNAQAQALARSRSGLIGLVVHDISDPYFGEIARQIQMRVFASGTQVLLTQTDRDAETESRAIRALIAQRVDALVIVGSSSYGASSDETLTAMLEGFARNGGLVVGIGQSPGVGRTIDVGDADGARALATALVVEGHRRFAVVGAHGPVPAAAHRTGGFLAGLAEAGLEAELSVEATLDRQGGHELARRVAEHLRGGAGGTGAGTSADADGSGGDRDGSGGAREGSQTAAPLCVFAPADVMALGAIGELRRQGLRVPQDVAVAGFGGVPAGVDASPTLSTLALPLEQIADTAVSWVLGEAGEDPEAAQAVWTAPGEIALRESTATASR